MFLFLSLLLHILFVALLAASSRFFVSVPSYQDESRTITVELLPVDLARTKKQVVETGRIEKSEVAAPDAYLGEQTQTVRHQTRASETAAFRQGQETKKSVTLGKLGVPMNMKPMGHLGPGERAATNDYLSEVKEGAQTLLNTREFAFFSYYQRVRHQLEQFWEPKLQERLEKMLNRGRMLASDRDHNTKLLVVMNSAGEITRILVESTSGLVDLDEVAIEAFNKAGPFPNPPAGMIERDGSVKIEWEFVLRT
ncbi:MAG: energy transducer TonB [Deltaproteobacteria bacterium]|nr:energy transducer TonB [Deltaproteobacteria bacterium]